MRHYAISKVYATALLELSEDERLDAVIADLDSLRELLAASPELREVFLSPELGLAQKRAVMERIMADAEDLSRRFVLMLLRRRREAALEGIVDALHNLRDQREGRVRGRIASARPLSDEELKRLEQSLGEAEGKEVILAAETDEDLLAGLVLSFDDRTLDGSLRTRLRRMKNRLLAAELGKE